MDVAFQPDLAGSPRLDDVLHVLMVEFAEWYSPARKPSSDFRKALDHTLRIVALNLLSATVSRPIPWINVIGRPVWYQENKLLLGPHFTHASSDAVMRFLREHGYVRFRPGTSSASKSFRRPNSIKPTGKLKALASTTNGGVFDVWSDPLAYPIRLRAAPDAHGKKEFVPFEPTGATMLMVDRLGTINKALLLHWADLEITDAQHREMLRYMARRDGEESTIDLTRRTVYRVFNNGTFEEGGRFYGGWWQQIPKAYRPHIMIDGKQTVEVDYSAIHPTILYTELGIPMPEDPYEIGIAGREIVKKTFNALINAGGPSINPIEGFSTDKAGMSWKEFLARVRRHFEPFKRYFGTGYGLKLQRLDSDIAEAVMLEFAKRGIPILPVHDSFIVHHGHESLLQQVMQQQFERVTGSTIRLKSVTLGRDRARKFPEGPATDDLFALVHPHGPYAEYDNRVDQWFATKYAGT